MEKTKVSEEFEYALLFQKGDSKGMDYFFNSIRTNLTYYVYKIVQDHDIADDVVSESFIKIWERRETFKHPKVIKSWLYTTARNGALNHLQQNKRNLINKEKLSNKQHGDYEYSPAEIKERKETISHLHDCIETLPTGCKRVFKMMFIEGMEVREVAKKLNLSISTIKNQKARGLQLLRKRIDNSEQLPSREIIVSTAIEIEPKKKTTKEISLFDRLAILNKETWDQLITGIMDKLVSDLNHKMPGYNELVNGSIQKAVQSAIDRISLFKSVEHIQKYIFASSFFEMRQDIKKNRLFAWTPEQVKERVEKLSFLYGEIIKNRIAERDNKDKIPFVYINHRNESPIDLIRSLVDFEINFTGLSSNDLDLLRKRIKETSYRQKRIIKLFCEGKSMLSVSEIEKISYGLVKTKFHKFYSSIRNLYPHPFLIGIHKHRSATVFFKLLNEYSFHGVSQIFREEIFDCPELLWSQTPNITKRTDAKLKELGLMKKNGASFSQLGKHFNITKKTAFRWYHDHIKSVESDTHQMNGYNKTA